jgi:hypothetical protein
LTVLTVIDNDNGKPCRCQLSITIGHGVKVVKVKLVKVMFSVLKNEFDHFDFDRKNKNVILKTNIICSLVNDDTPANDRNAVELTMMSDVVIEYEKEHFPIENHRWLS